MNAQQFIERNSVIVRRGLAGESGVKLAKEFGLTSSRISKILAAARKDMKLPTRETEALEAAPFTGTVTVCPGYQPRPQLSFDMAMREAAIKARAVQGRMLALSSRQGAAL